MEEISLYFLFLTVKKNWALFPLKNSIKFSTNSFLTFKGLVHLISTVLSYLTIRRPHSIYSIKNRAKKKAYTHTHHAIPEI